METIYVDTLICVNLFIDYVLLCITKRILHINAKGRYLLLSAVFGGLTTLWVLLPIHSVFISALYKIITTVLIILIAFGKADFRKITTRILLFLGLSMITSVIITAFNLMYKPKGIFIFNNQIYLDISPTILIISTGLAYLSISLYQRLISTKKLNCRIYTITLCTDTKSKVTFESALDTGCNLKEPFSGLPVILTEKTLLKDIDISENKMRIIPYSTISGSDIIYAFKPKEIQVDGKTIQNGCYIGICNKKINGEVRAIMGPQIVEAL